MKIATLIISIYDVDILLYMDLNLNINLASAYKSKSQIARVLTEAWFDDNMYCPACPSNDLERLPDNMKVIDFLCPKCDEKFQKYLQVDGQDCRRGKRSLVFSKVKLLVNPTSENTSFFYTS